MMLLLATHRRAIEQDRMVREGRWTEGRPQLLKVPRLMGQTLGFIAFGRVARAVAERARPFGLRMMAFDPFLDELDISAHGVEPASLSEVLSQLRLHLHAPAGHARGGRLPEGAALPADEDERHLHQHRAWPDRDRVGADQGAAGEMDRRRRSRRAAGGAGQARQPAAQDAARDPVAAQRLGVRALRSRAQAPRRPGAGAGSDRALADVVRQPDRAAGSGLRRWQPVSMERGPNS